MPAPEPGKLPQPRQRTITSGRGLFFLVIIAAAFIGVIFLGSRVAERMAALRAAPQDNVQWALAQLDVELLAFEVAAQNARDGSPEATAEMRRRFDVFYSRVNTIGSMDVITPGNLASDAPASLAQINQAMAAMAGEIDSPDDVLRAKLPAIIGEIEKIRPVARKITLEGVKLLNCTEN
jgi:hypothetical protein